MANGPENQDQLSREINQFFYLVRELATNLKLQSTQSKLTDSAVRNLDKMLKFHSTNLVESAKNLRSQGIEPKEYLISIREEFDPQIVEQIEDLLDRS